MCIYVVELIHRTQKVSHNSPQLQSLFKILRRVITHGLM